MKRTHKEFIPVMLTPFQDNGEVDYQGLSRLIEFYLESGVSGLFANCQSSEMYALDDKERMSILKHVMNVVDGAVPVVATGAFGGSVEEQADSIKRMYDTDIRAAIIITCLIAAKDEPDELFNERVFRLLDLTEAVPLGFYECPEPYKRTLSAEQLSRFVDTGRVIYHKDTCLDIDLVKAKLAATDRDGFGLYDAYMVNAVESLKAGAKGLSCIQGNFFPELIVWLCINYDQPASEAKVGKLQQFLTANMDLMHTIYPAIAKYFLCRRGVLKNSVSRVNEGGFNATVRQSIDKLFIAYEDLRRELGASDRFPG